jgi:EmrB/QacA subfamily drug resistance transporter
VKRKYLVFSVISLSLAFAGASGTSTAVAFPAITTYFNISLVIAGWVLSANPVASAVVMPIFGKLSDVVERKSTFQLCMLIFTLSSFFCAISSNVVLLIIFRTTQGIGMGGLMPCATGIISDEFSEQRQRFIGLLNSVTPIAMIIGPNLGGWLTEVYGWRSTFWINVPFGILIMIFSQWLIVPSKRVPLQNRVDFLGAGLMFSSSFVLLLGFTFANETLNSRIPLQFVILFFVLVLALFLIFLWQEHRVKEPFVDLDLLKRKQFLASNAYQFIFGLVGLGVLSLIPLYAVSIYHMNTLESGAILTPRSIGMIAGSIVVSVYIIRWGYRWPIIIGTLTVGLSLFVLSFQVHEISVAGLEFGFIPLILTVMLISGIGHGISTPASNNACIEMLPAKVATIIGLRGMFRHLGSAIGVAVGTIILSYFDNIESAFKILMLGSVVILILSIPLILAMPASPNSYLPDRNK